MFNVLLSHIAGLLFLGMLVCVVFWIVFGLAGLASEFPFSNIIAVALIWFGVNYILHNVK